MRGPSLARLFSIGLLFLVACVHKYAVPAVPVTAGKISGSATVYLVRPDDGRDDTSRTYQGSGDWTQEAIAHALRETGRQVIPGSTAHTLAEVSAAASSAGAEIIVWPQIMHWSDRLTEWSGVPDRITLSLRVFDVAAGRVVNRQEVRASSRWATFGGDHPQELLPELTRRWAETLSN